ncbi:unnamed protein product [Pieris macdunnoughi]|uniref:PH domain-containing protein n=1 Tax=Pieris macdunnoughi TaxID=345717 RepID=A0A821W8I5_9NEOP|nr:unnamed protein product [Pieris macdunnoughi]
MDAKKTIPATQQPLTHQHIMAHHVHPDQIYTQQQMSNHVTSNPPIQNQPNGVIHQHQQQQQLIQNQYHATMTARSPLLENRHEIYGTSHNHEYARHYGANDNYNYQQQQSPTTERTEQIIHTDHNVNHDIVHNIPKGYNAEVYQDYLKRNPPKDSNQIYQNHQPMYRPNMNQYGSKPYLPYSNRIGPQSNTELLRRQYNEIQQLKMQQQLHYQNQAQMHQQQKFAERQLLLQQIHGVQPPPNLQNSIYSDSSYRDLDRYGSRNDFKEYTGDIQKDVDKYAKNNEYREIERQNKQFQEAQWQHNQEGFKEIERYRSPPEEEKTKHRSPPTDFNNQLKRNTGTMSPMKSSESSSPSVKSPSTESRRSSSGQALRSPTAQRIPSAPVTISGMLYKQGSDGLKVWRKRWFVLSEYCLFYYKSQDEEKLLGSVLLPSYKVSACTSEDKVMRKYAFKLEHANMRTYVLAAMDQESMMKWVKGLTMAALMQNYSEHQRKQIERTAKPEDDDIPGPTYANAPPKPRRSNDGYNSPGSDIYDPNYDLLIKPESQYNQSTSKQYQDQYGSKANQEAYARTPQSPPQQPLYQTKRSNELHNVSGSNHERPQELYKYPQSPPFETRRLPDENMYQTQNNPFLQNYSSQETRVPPLETQNTDQKSVKSYGDNYPESKTRNDPNAHARDVYGELKDLKPVPTNSVNDRIMERRTPDAYGRSTTMSSYKNKLGDYEDVYSPYSSENPAKSPNLSLHRDNISLSSQKQQQKPNQSQEKVFSGPSVLRRKKMQASGIQPPMPRPHSADFLEYEARNESLNKTMPTRNNLDLHKNPQRPKSSLDINSYYDPSSETYYSEESYAEKMRQSAQYLQQQGLAPRNIQIPLAKYASGLAEKQLQSPYAHTQNNNYETEFGAKQRDNISYTSKYSDLEGLNSNWMLKEKDLEQQKDYLNRSGSVMSDGSNGSYLKEASKLEPNSDGFIRSASARLPTTERDGEKKVQQREESMKRLLEWKQRMLQSPLTRKSTPATISLARSLNQSRQSLRSDQYKPKTYSNNSYNSYSSDDEEETPGTDLQNSSAMQAGRSYIQGIESPSITKPKSPHEPCSVLLPDQKFEITSVSKNNSSLQNAYENINVEESMAENVKSNAQEEHIYEDHIPQLIDMPEETEQTSAVICDGYETHESESESEAQLEYTDNDLDEVLLESDTETSKQDNNELASNQSETPPILPLSEDHYLPMSPRKLLSIEPAHRMILENLSVFDQSMPITYEDNPYVEMNLGGEEDDMQTYEIVCVNNGKMVEPVYMELNNLTAADQEIENTNLKDCHSDTASNFADTKDPTLRRVSKTEKNKEKAEGSDADDECSKDLSIDAPFSRLSISDTFRPASYYLSCSSMILDRQDSSDSDILPPPPIPSSSPPCEELNDEALSRYILDKLDKSDISQDNSILKMLTNENQNMNKMKRKATSLMIYGSRTSIHDTLTRGEKIRHNRASLTNDRSKLLEEKETINLLNRSLFDLKNNSSDCIDSDSFRSCIVDRDSSRLSLDSDVSSKFEITPSNISSELTSLADGDSIYDLRNSSDCADANLLRKNQFVSETYLLSQIERSDLIQLNRTSNERDTSCNPEETKMNKTQTSTNSENLNIVCSHTRSSSTPVSCKSNIIRDRSNSHALESKRIDTQYKNIADHTSGYIGSQSSCSSLGVSHSPISFYTKYSKGETLLRKNLNKTTDKVKEIKKINIKEKYNASSTTTGFHSRESSAEHSAPYYYSDLSSQEHIDILPTSHYMKNTNIHRKLNNQRRKGLLHKRNDITHIHNPIHSNNVFVSDNSFELAAARSVSVEFLSATEKDPEIDIKNLYESSSSKRSKIPESIGLLGSLGCKRNTSNSKFSSEEKTVSDHSELQQRNLLKARVSTGSMSSHCSENSSNTVYYDAETEATTYENIFVGEKHWDEDQLWRDNLRRVSHRHARSMDDLDALPESISSNNTPDFNSIKRVKKVVSNNKVSRNVTYVNCDIQAQILRKDKKVGHAIPDENDVYVSLANDVNIASDNTIVDEGVYEQLSIDTTEISSNDICNSKEKQSKINRKQFEIDRETLRQWDLMSSGLMKDGSRLVRGAVMGVNVNEAACTDNRTENASKGTSLTISGTNIESNANNNQIQQTLSNKSFVGSNTSIGRSNRDGNIPVRAVSPRVRWVEDKANEHYTSQQISASQHNLNILPGTEESWATIRSPSRMSQQPVSAVSPRVRRNTETDEMKKVSRELVDIPTAGELLGRSHEELVLLLIQLRRRHAAIHRSIEQCCHQINSIEECLSSLKALEREESLRRLEQLKMQLMELEQQYAKSKPLVQLVDNMVKLGSLYNKPGSTIERLERNQRLRHKVLAEHAVEQQRWLESAAAGKPLETEAARARVAELWALEQELADEASILQGLKTDKDAIESLLSGVRSKLDTVNLEDPLHGGGLEVELARVHAMLAHNSKKLEQTVAENARLERELQQLRRALRARRAAPQPTHSHPTQPAQPTHPTAMLEDEVTRVQQLVTALQRQRQELSRAVRHLTQQSQVLQTTQDSMPGQHRPLSYWQETNLDTGHTIDHGQDYEYDSHPIHYGQTEPLYVDTRPGDITSPMTSEDMQHSAFGHLSNVEKQEIKTVRIVKRESERRQRDRERSLQPMSDWSNNITTNIDQFLEEELVQPINNYRASSVPRTDYSKFEEYYAKQNKETPYLKFERNMELSPKYPSSPSLSNYDYSRDYKYSYDRLTLSNQYLNSPTESSRTLTNDISKTSSVMSLTRSNMELSPIFKSEAAKEIITEMSDTHKNGSLHRRQVPKEKRRHYTAPHHLSAKTLNELPKNGYKQDAMARSVDDADMERALRGAAPDVVRSALPATKIRDSIDQLLAAPQKIVIPERYIPEKPPELSPEEQQKRQEKVESIKKMLSSSSGDQTSTKSPDGEKRQREHLLQMNQILAKQVTEMSKIIAVKALEELPLTNNADDSDRSPDVELPIYQQRDNFFT